MLRQEDFAKAVKQGRNCIKRKDYYDAFDEYSKAKSILNSGEASDRRNLYKEEISVPKAQENRPFLYAGNRVF